MNLTPYVTKSLGSYFTIKYKSMAIYLEAIAFQLTKKISFQIL